MKITSLEALSYLYQLDLPFAAAWDPVPRRALSETIVMVHTDEGLTGYCGGAPVPDLVLLERLLVGIDPTDTDRVFGICETVDFHGGRNWTVEVAVWDLVAKAAGVPLWRLLGGQRDRFPVYQSTGERVGPEERAERLLATRESGIGAAKIRFHHPDWRKDLKVVERAREAVGTGFALMVDANQGWRMPGDLTPRWDLATARQCAAALSDLNVYWLEEPLDSNAVDDYVRLREKSSIRIAAGEMVRSLPESIRLIEAGAVDIIQNDVVLAGGVGGCRKVAEVARAAGVTWSPHTWSTGYGLVTNLQVALALSDGEYLEMPLDPPAWTEEQRDFMLPVPLEVDASGCLVAPTGPGLGVEPDLAAIERWRVD